jgi:hypothetical protein
MSLSKPVDQGFQVRITNVANSDLFVHRQTGQQKPVGVGWS